MKKFLLLLTLSCIVFQSQATIRRIGYIGAPVANIDFSYNNMQFAANTAAPGDTLQIYQQLAVNQVYILEINKPLTIIGFGHSLNSNSGDQVINKSDSIINKIENLVFSVGSAGSSVQGLNLNSCFIGDSNITITRCRFKGEYALSTFNACGSASPFLYPLTGGMINIQALNYNLNNIFINGNYFDLNTYGASSIICTGTYTMTNVQITNNYFNGKVNLSTGTTGQVYGVFANNIMNHKFQHLFELYNHNGNICSQGPFYPYLPFIQSNFDYFNIKNNIINTDDTTSCTIIAPTSIVQNNIFSIASQYACPSAISSNNIFKANMTDVFGASWNDGLVYNDNQLVLGTSSPALNAGIKENLTPTHCGIFGGELGQTYKLSGIPSVPSFYQLSTPGLNATTNPFNVTISVKSNN